MTKKRNSSKKKAVSRKKGHRKNASSDVAKLWAKSIFTKLKELESHGEKAMKTVYGKINKSGKKPNKRKQAKQTVFMTSYANLKTMPFVKRKSQPINRFKLASVVLAVLIVFTVFKGVASISDYVSSPSKSTRSSWVDRVSKKRVAPKRVKKLKRKRPIRKRLKFERKKKSFKSKKRVRRKNRSRRRHVASKK